MNIEAVDEIFDTWLGCHDKEGVHRQCKLSDETRRRLNRQICQLFSAKGTNAIDYLEGYIEGKKHLSKPTESRLLTTTEMMHVIYSVPPREPGEDYSRLMEATAKAQRDLTASIIHQEYAARGEHLAHLVDDVIKLEEKLKSKDEECAKDKERFAASVYDSGFEVGKMEARIECRQRVEGIKKRVEDAEDYPPDSDWWQKLWKEEGI